MNGPLRGSRIDLKPLKINFNKNEATWKFVVFYFPKSIKKTETRDKIVLSVKFVENRHCCGCCTGKEFGDSLQVLFLRNLLIRLNMQFWKNINITLNLHVS